jgi:hypothetical protein
MSKKNEDICIKAVRDGLREGFTNLTPEMENLFRLVYRMGYKQCTIDQVENEHERTN